MKIDPAKHGWMTALPTQAVMAALGPARFVGGAVRNAIAGAPVIDIDIAVPMPPEETLKRLEAANIRAIPTGIAHGTVTAIKDGQAFEITSLRRDVATDGRHAVVAYTDDWEEDASRRDFTMNALYADMDGSVSDYHGGVEDLIAGQVRFVGEPAARIAEDYLRILRLFRFQAWYGKGEMDGAALRAAAQARSHLAELSGERIAKELLRLLECANPVPVVRLMAASAILPELLPGLLHPARLEHLALIDAGEKFAPDPVLRLAALLPDDAQAARDVSARLKLSGADRDRLADVLTPRDLPVSAGDVRRLLYRIGAPRFKDRVLLRWAGGAQGAGALQARLLLEMANTWVRPKFPLNGSDVMAAGVAQGPDVGRALADVEDWWMQNDFVPGQAALAQKLAEIVKAP